jgi:hypothetical protein
LKQIELVDPRDENVLVIRAVEDGDLAPLRKGFVDAPEVIVRQFLVGGLLEAVNVDALRIEPEKMCLTAPSLPAASMA